MGHMIELTVVSRNSAQLGVKIDAEAGQEQFEWGYATHVGGSRSFARGCDKLRT